MIDVNGIEQKKILLIDDEENILEILQTVLLNEGFKHIYKANCGYEGIDICRKINPDMIVLDIMLPDINGFDVCKKIREITLAPIMFLSAKNEDVDKLLGLGIGGDDYITKPFSPREIVFRIKAHLRRIEYSKKNTNMPNQFEISFGNIVINGAKGEVLKDGKTVVLTAKEYELLLYLAKNSNYIISKKNLFETVWNEPYLGCDNSLMVHIRRLRKKLEDNPSSPKYIITVKGLGYKLSTKGDK